MELQEILNAIYRIPEASADRLASCSVRIDRPKGCRILEAGKVETDLFFIARGIARAYIPKGDREITFWIGQEGTAIVSLRSYVCNGAGYESVELCKQNHYIIAHFHWFYIYQLIFSLKDLSFAVGRIVPPPHCQLPVWL